MDALMELRGVSKRYGRVTAVDCVDLAVEEGKILTIIGPNGAGKTTLLRLMALLEKPTSGEILYRGVRVDEASEDVRRRIVMVFQRTTLFSASVYENVAYGLRIRGYGRDEVDARIREVLEVVDMAEHADRHVRELSGGERRRVAIAQALAPKPELLLLDEPLSDVDPPTAEAIEEVIRELAGDLTIVHATHDLLQAARLSDVIAFMRDGRIIQIGRAGEVFRRPVDAFIARFVGFENIFDGVVIGVEGGIAKIAVGDVLIEAVTERRGRCKVALRPEDIVLSVTPLESSMRNTLRGRIIDYVDAGALVKVLVDVDGVTFRVLITKRSFLNMKLRKGLPIYLSFKASSIHVF